MVLASATSYCDWFIPASWQRIAHQDLKPSNVLVFKDVGSKLGDLGRASAKDQNPPHENFDIAGDPAYAPFELLYGYKDPEWHRRRQGCDAYLMGSMVIFFFAGVGITALTKKHLDVDHVWGKWTGTYSEVLPYLRNAFETALEEFMGLVHPKLKDGLSQVVRELCEPDLGLRGHPKNRFPISVQYSMERYISKFNVLAREAELGLLRD